MFHISWINTRCLWVPCLSARRRGALATKLKMDRLGPQTAGPAGNISISNFKPLQHANSIDLMNDDYKYTITKKNTILNSSTRKIFCIALCLHLWVGGRNGLWKVQLWKGQYHTGNDEEDCCDNDRIVIFGCLRSHVMGIEQWKSNFTLQMFFLESGRGRNIVTACKSCRIKHFFNKSCHVKLLFIKSCHLPI